MMPGMKPLMKLFFRTLRLVLDPVMLLWERVSRPSAIMRPAADQADIDRQCQDLALYQFRTCPFCIKVRHELRRLSLDIEHRDAQYDTRHRADLVQGCGAPKVPCLKITDSSGKVQWLSDSGEIIAYLRGRFANT
jgi:glutaredoxin